MWYSFCICIWTTTVKWKTFHMHFVHVFSKAISLHYVEKESCSFIGFLQCEWSKMYWREMWIITPWWLTFKHQHHLWNVDCKFQYLLDHRNLAFITFITVYYILTINISQRRIFHWNMLILILKEDECSKFQTVK